MLRSGVPVEVVSSLLGHASVTTTSATYAHLTVADTRAALVRAGVLAPRTPRDLGRGRCRCGRAAVSSRLDGAGTRGGATGVRGARLVGRRGRPGASAGPCRVAGCDRLARGHGPVRRASAAVGRRRDVPSWPSSLRAPIRAGRVSAQPGLPGRGMPVRVGASRLVPVTRPAVGTFRTPRPGAVARLGAAADQAARCGRVCQVPGCVLWPQASGPFCHPHHGTWRANGRPDPVVFARTSSPRCESPRSGHRPDPAG